MKTRALFASLLLTLAGCAIINRPSCDLHGAKPLEACHDDAASTWRSFDGTRLPYKEWPSAQGKPRAVVILVPGWDSVTCDYRALARHLSAHGYTVTGSELRAQRYDPVISRRGNPKDWQAWVKDLRAFTEFSAKRYPGVPLFIHGQSFGTLIAMDAVGTGEVRNVRGVILHSPAVAMFATKPDFIAKFVVNTMPGIKFPQLVGMEIEKMELTPDREFNCQWMHSSNRLRSGYTFRFLRLANELGVEAEHAARRIRVPVLALKGDKDTLALVTVTNEIYDHFLDTELPKGTKVIRYPEGGHLLTDGNVPTKRQAIHDITSWLDAHAGR